MIHVETPRPSKGVLLAADDAVAAVQDTLARHLRPGESGCEVVTEELIAWHLRSLRRLLARRAAVDSGQDGKAAAAVSRPVEPPAATQGSAGERLAPGSGAAFSGAVTESDGAVVAPIAGALLPAGRPPLPGGDFLLPRDVRCR